MRTPDDAPPESEVRRLLVALGELPTDPLLGLLITPEEREALAVELAAVEEEREKKRGTG